MKLYESFPNPPIVEALVDIRANLPQSVGLDELASIHNSVRDRFPVREERTRWEGRFELKEDGPLLSGMTRGGHGYQYRSSDGSSIFQARLDGFTFNQLPPYTGWDKLITEAKELWKLFARTARPINVTRIAIRYINRIEIPLPIDNLKEYLRTAPEIAPDAPQGMSEFFMRLVLPDPLTGCTAIVTQTNGAPPPDLRFLPIIFDLDVYHEGPMNPNSPKIWEEFIKLRDFRNRIFYGSITEKTREIFR